MTGISLLDGQPCGSRPRLPGTPSVPRFMAAVAARTSGCNILLSEEEPKLQCQVALKHAEQSRGRRGLRLSTSATVCMACLPKRRFCGTGSEWRRVAHGRTHKDWAQGPLHRAPRCRWQISHHPRSRPLHLPGGGHWTLPWHSVDKLGDGWLIVASPIHKNDVRSPLCTLTTTSEVDSTHSPLHFHKQLAPHVNLWNVQSLECSKGPAGSSMPLAPRITPSTSRSGAPLRSS